MAGDEEDRASDVTADVSDVVRARRMRRRRTSVVVVAGVMAAVLAVLALAAWTPWLDEDLSGVQATSSTYAQAMSRAAELQAEDGPDVRPECRSRVITPGRPTDKVVVLLHGFTNCPAQYAVIAQAYADAGYSVIVPRLPAHGLTDRLTDGPSDVTAPELVAATDRALDIADGLGGGTTVVGLSAGGTLAAWAAGHRDDVETAVIIAPLMLPKVVPDAVLAPFTRLAGHLPDFYLWWDFNLREQLEQPAYAYPRYSLHNLAAFLAVGRAAQDEVLRTTPLQRLVVITNENDDAVSNAPAGEFETRLANSAVRDDSWQIPAGKGWGHDLVSPEGENATRIREVYETLGQVLGLPDLAARVSG